jgi:hypothetical protein
MNAKPPAQAFNGASTNDSTMTVDDLGNKVWKNAQGQHHRLDGPAYEGADGSKSWWINNKRHRLDGPAEEWPNGTKLWWINDRLHRLDGPAVEYADGTKSWWIEGENYTEKAFNKHPAVLEFQRSRQAELEATEKAEAEAKKRKLDEMHKVYGAFVRDFRRTIRRPQ